MDCVWVFVTGTQRLSCGNKHLELDNEFCEGNSQNIMLYDMTTHEKKVCICFAEMFVLKSKAILATSWGFFFCCL